MPPVPCGSVLLHFVASDITVLAAFAAAGLATCGRILPPRLAYARAGVYRELYNINQNHFFTANAALKNKSPYKLNLQPEAER